MMQNQTSNTWSVRPVPLLSCAAIAAAVLLGASSVIAQESSLFREKLTTMQQVPLTLDNGLTIDNASWIYIPPILPRRIAIRDRVASSTGATPNTAARWPVST